jgi:hypothetical protein
MAARRGGPWAAALGLALAVPASGEELGSQRVATSMLTFLKIGVGARAAGLGEAFVPIADDATTLHWNPAGLADLSKRRAHVSHTEWPADIDYENLIYAQPGVLGGGIGVQVASLRTQLEFTSEAEPLPHGRTFDYSDWLVGVGYARQFTDRFTLGLGVKYLREDLGSQVGGSVLHSWSLDMGTVFRLPYRGFRVSMAWTNFGPEFQPPGGYRSASPTAPNDVRYASFSPTSVFAFGVALEPIQHAHYRLLTALQFDHPADATELFRGGVELWIDDMVALRGGWNPRADTMKLAAGAGLRGGFGGRVVRIDYAWTDGDALGRVDRFSVEVEF